MYMSYSKNPHLPRVRMKAVLLVRRGWSIRRVARYMGFSHAAIINWLKRAPSDGRLNIPTLSSRPKSHPKSLSRDIVKMIVKIRKERNRCAEAIHQQLLNEGTKVSLSSVKRTLKRNLLLRERSPWKRWHITDPRPIVQNPGDLVQIDTIHFVTYEGLRFYVYTLLDVASRWTYARVSLRINTHNSLKFVKEAQKKAEFKFKMLQSDHGSEFSAWFTEHVRKLEMNHRHSRVRQANDNGHLERFNRTLQEECLNQVIPMSPEGYQRTIKRYLPYYNNERLHLGIKLLTPMQVVTSY